jgi:hypothetical protein
MATVIVVVMATANRASAKMDAFKRELPLLLLSVTFSHLHPISLSSLFFFSSLT